MGGSLKILHLADSHIGADWPSRSRHEWPRRGDDFVASFSRLVDRAIEQGVDLVIHAGDLFDTPEPGSRSLAAASDILLKPAAAGIPVVLVPGNHERHAISSTLLLAHPDIHVMSAPRTVSFRLHGIRISVSAFACSRRNAARKFPAMLQATGWATAPAEVKILALHETFDSAVCGSGNYRFRSGDDVIERDAVPAGFDYVACGHIHRHQELRRSTGDGPAIVYAGSTDRISFAEALEPKGIVIVEEESGRLACTFAEHEVRPMSVCPLLVSDLSRAQIMEQVEAVITSLPPRAVAQIRLAGIVSPDDLREARFTQMARKLRPDALVTVSAQAVEFSGGGDAEFTEAGAEGDRPFSRHIGHGEPALRREGGAARSVSGGAAELPPPAAELLLEDAGGLPTTCGVYALYDAANRLLYVGKARNVRTRVRTHLRGGSGAHFFRGWGRQIARIVVREAQSDLEALLLEGEMIRSLRPAFNRQMRGWASYCYLSANGLPYAQLAVTAEADSKQPCFGPFRSRYTAEAVREAAAAHFGLAFCPDTGPPSIREPLLPPSTTGGPCHRYYRGSCGGPCSGRISDEDYQRRIARRDALLLGLDDATVRDLEAELQSPSRTASNDETLARVSDLGVLLRSVFDHCAILRRAEAVLNGMLVLPGKADTRKVAFLTPVGIRFDALERDPIDAERILRQHRAFLREGESDRGARLPKEILDGLCIVIRELAKSSQGYRLFTQEETSELDASAFSTAVFTAEPHRVAAAAVTPSAPPGGQTTRKSPAAQSTSTPCC